MFNQYTWDSLTSGCLALCSVEEEQERIYMHPSGGLCASQVVKWSEVKVAQSCPTLCNPMDYTVRGILQARILERVAFPFCRGSSQPRDRNQVSCIAGGFFTSWVTREAQKYWSGPIPFPVDLPNPGIKPGSPTLQADSLPTELTGKPQGGMFKLTLARSQKVFMLNKHCRKCQPE